MEFNFEKNTVTIFGKSEKINSVALKLSAISGEQIYSFFAAKDAYIPRMLNIYAMFSVLNGKIKDLSAVSFPADYLMKLKYYKDFSETQLFNLFYNLANDAQSFKQYRINLMRLIIINANKLNLVDGDIQYLKNLGKMKIEKFVDYFQYITSFCVEGLDSFDGVSKELLKDNLINTCTAQDVNDIALKYGIEFDVNEDTNVNDLVDSLFATLDEYSFVTVDTSEFVIFDDCKPLEFSLNEEAINAEDESKRAISYEGEENDEFNPIEIEDEVEDEPQGLTVTVVESNVEEETSNDLEPENEEYEMSEADEALVNEALSSIEEPEAKEEKKEAKPELEAAIPLVLDEVESTSTEKQLGFNDVRANHMRGNTKIENYIKAPVKLITGSILGALALAAAIVVIVIILK